MDCNSILNGTLRIHLISSRTNKTKIKNLKKHFHPKEHIAQTMGANCTHRNLLPHNPTHFLALKDGSRTNQHDMEGLMANLENLRTNWDEASRLAILLDSLIANSDR